MDKLPVELVVTMFEYLDYEDLKHTIPLVCKRFQTILLNSVNSKHGVIRQNLFIDEPNSAIPNRKTLHLHTEAQDIEADGITKTYYPTSEFQVHPIFKTITIDFNRYEYNEERSEERDSMDLILVNNRPLDLHDYGIFLEIAISPAVGPDCIIFRKSSFMDTPMKIYNQEFWEKRSVRVLNIVVGAIGTVLQKLRSIDDMRQRVALSRPNHVVAENIERRLSTIEKMTKEGYIWPGGLNIQVDGDGHVHVFVVWSSMDDILHEYGL